MSPEAQRIAIAEACGWTIHQITVGDMLDVAVLPPGMEPSGENVFAHGNREVPDYLTDLNAMHEAEKVFLFTKRQQYYRHLQQVRSSGFKGTFTLMECCRATAAQRAEAFLRTIGKWEEGK